MQVLAGDVGGTKTLLALAEVGRETPLSPVSVRLRATRRYDSARYPGLASICAAYADELGEPLPPLAAFGVAGPVVAGRCHTTNLPWVLDERDLASAMGVRAVRLANDFHTLALGIGDVAPSERVALNEGASDPAGPVAVLGAGTGLGEAITVRLPSGARHVLATEGGHSSFAPRSELEVGVLRFLLSRHAHVSWERVLSGDGLVNLAEALAALLDLPLPEALAQGLRLDRAAAPALVTDCAAQGDPLCRRAVELFCSLYGAEAGNLALKSLATGGVFVAGGIAPRLLPELRKGAFREAFLDKGRMRPVLEAIRVEVVLDPHAALLGAALLAATAS